MEPISHSICPFRIEGVAIGGEKVAPGFVEMIDP
jgi:hypothetical protein